MFCYKNILYWMYNMIVNIDSLICKNSADFPECRKWNIWYLFWLLLTIKFNYFIRFSALGHKIHFYNFKYQGILKSLFFDNADNTFWFYSLPNPINLYSPNFKNNFPTTHCLMIPCVQAGLFVRLSLWDYPLQPNSVTNMDTTENNDCLSLNRQYCTREV